MPLSWEDRGFIRIQKSGMGVLLFVMHVSLDAINTVDVLASLLLSTSH